MKSIGPNQSKLAGIVRYAKIKKWNVQVIEPTEKADQVQKLIGFWKPIGCIVEASCDKKPYRPKDFGNTPVVFTNCDPALIGTQAPCVVNNSHAIAELAARELLAFNARHFSKQSDRTQSC
ncbi:MAG: hypothetical protein R6V06_03670 [Kiritimatiellia bacterium]